MFIGRDLTPLSHNCLISESKEMQGLSDLWGNAASQQSRSGCMWRTWSGFKGNGMWTLKENTAEDMDGDGEGAGCKWLIQKLKQREERDKEEGHACGNEEVKPEKALTEGANLCRRGADELRFERRCSIPWTLLGPSAWSYIYRVWCLSHGCRK